MSVKQIDLIRIYSTKRCLIVDDISEVRGSLMRMLRTFGAENIETAATGEDAVEMCRAREYGIVLCDYNLGSGKDGQQILEELRHFKLLKNTSLFVMITAEQSRRMVLAALEYQPDEYIAKPITPSILRTRLDRALLKHESFLDIKKALDDEDVPEALALCQGRIERGEKYAASAVQMEAEFHYRLNDLDSAQNIYDAVLAKKSTVWAHLGLGKVHLSRGNFAAAEEQFQAVLGADENYVEAHDLRADNYEEQGDSVRAQEAMQRGVSISSKSVLRQRQLASLARKNNDQETCIKACRDTVKLSANSCYETPQDSLTLARELTKAADGNDSQEGRNFAKDAMNVLQKTEKRYSSDKSVELQSTAMRSRVLNVQKKIDDARKMLDRAKNMREDMVANGVDIPAEAQLDYADVLMSSGDDEGAVLLAQVANNFSDREDIVERVDALSDEPVSKKGRKKVAKLTKQGISCYEAKDFDESVAVFTNAVNTFPKHTGLNLNLVQAALAKSKRDGCDEKLGKVCREALVAVGELDEDHPQAERYQFLLKQVGQAYPE